MYKLKASTQVVEMSYVLPVAMIVVLSLVYLEFGMFLYVHINNIARETICELQDSVGKSDDLYWQITGDYIDDSSLKSIEKEFEEKLNGCAILPGLKFDSSCSIVSSIKEPKVCVYVKATYFDKQIFKIDLEEDINTPYEFALVADFGYSIFEDFEVLKDIYYALF